MIQLHAGNYTGPAGRLRDHCPLCHSKIVPTALQSLRRRASQTGVREVQVAFACPNSGCEGMFIAYYELKQGPPPTIRGVPVQEAAYLKSCRPNNHVSRAFTADISSISPSFCQIYNEASSAEATDLREVCGVGYRKALEFLLKDYAITLNASKVDEIKKAPLGQVIALYVTDPHVKSTAKRATWLGNDETHYVRKWEDKDLSDLKGIIELVLHWVNAERLTAALAASMPEAGPAAPP
jgi:hypothetical protein